MIKEIFKVFSFLIGGTILITFGSVLLYYLVEKAADLIRHIVIEWVPFINTFPEWLALVSAGLCLFFIVATVIVYLDLMRDKRTY